MRDRLFKRLESIPDIVDFVDEDGRDLGWGEWELTLAHKLLIAECMIAWHQGFEKTVTRMIRAGLRSLLRKAKEAENG